ncbi:MAG: hybrid sensor histidine kinase/response regulator [Desulfovibrionaceae bacterium]|nr:hybrid sensor histidine kinase/response regulator [Desulfovibrionaceae bacterium]MBF0513713.1 hybrid sensor histidine kinase/response regulator [Desulfovibrionaceae bacterium]
MSDLEKATVLIVDDTPDNIRVLLESLKNDYAVMAATNGPKAIELASGNKQPDIILLDVMMPGMDGYEVCSRLKADPQTAEIPVIFVTALSQPEDEAKGLAVGAIDYLTKPFNPALVKARVKNHIELRTAAKLREDVERIMHHDLKNPLSAVMSLPMLLSMAGNLTPEQKDMLRRIEEAGQAMLAMINATLDLFKIERGVYRLCPEDVDVAGLVLRIFRDFEELAQTHGVKLIATVDGALLGGQRVFMVRGEEMLCYSMLSNLIRNAVQASPEGGAVTVAMTSGEAARIGIHNFGSVPEDMRERFFEKYATSGKRGGTGIGTYSARLNAEVQGGAISLSAAESGQTTVSVTLPV